MNRPPNLYSIQLTLEKHFNNIVDKIMKKIDYNNVDIFITMVCTFKVVYINRDASFQAIA